jgi:DedD protein
MAKQIITDEALQLKRQARRRLIGAIALTLLVVILLPMILDREPPAPSQDVELQIPDKDKAGEFLPKMALPPSAAASGVPASAPPIAPLMDGKVAPASVVSPVSAVAAVAVPGPAQPVVKAQPAVPATVTVAPAHTEAAHTAAAKPAASKPAAKAATPAKHHKGFVVQVGAFANASAATKLKDKLHKQGYPSYTEKVGSKTRVRVGDYTSHAEADKIRRKLEIQGMQPDVVNLN